MELEALAGVLEFLILLPSFHYYSFSLSLERSDFMSPDGLISEAIAYSGMMLILGAFLLETRNVLDSKNKIYLLMMATGSGLLAIRALLIDEWAFLILEIVWCLAAIVALIGLTSKSVNQEQHIHE